jgi:hypothetical protein
MKFNQKKLFKTFLFHTMFTFLFGTKKNLFYDNKIWVMLNGAPGVLVKHI